MAGDARGRPSSAGRRASGEAGGGEAARRGEVRRADCVSGARRGVSQGWVPGPRGASGEAAEAQAAWEAGQAIWAPGAGARAAASGGLGVRVRGAG